MRKYCEENERVKCAYFRYLREANRKSDDAIDKVAAALIRFEESTGFKPFKKFHIQQAIAFKEALRAARHPKTGAPLSVATVSGTLRMVKAFFKWLAWRPGYKSVVSPCDAEYFNLSARDEAIARAAPEKPFPSMEQTLHVFRTMPGETLIERRNRALFALLAVTGIRVAAATSLKLKHFNLDAEEVF